MKEPNLIIENLKAILEECTASEDAVSYVNSEDAGTLKAAIEALEKQEQDRWIPVTERLPEYGKEVLTQLSDNDIVVNWVIDEEDGEWFEYGVVAWRPLPELYEGRRDGNK